MQAGSIQSIRVVTRTIDTGRVAFNQVVLQQANPPTGILFVAIDPAAGLFVWLRPHATVAPQTLPQAPGYSRMLPAFDPNNPPPHMGPGVFIPMAQIDAKLWAEITAANTNALNKAIRDAFGLG